MYMIKGEMNLHYLAPDGAEKVALVREGEIIYCPRACGTRRVSRPTRPAGAGAQAPLRREGPFLLVLREMPRGTLRGGRHVSDYREDPVSRVYEEFYSEESRRTCASCGHVTPRPAG